MSRSGSSWNAAAAAFPIINGARQTVYCPELFTTGSVIVRLSGCRRDRIWRSYVYLTVQIHGWYRPFCSVWEVLSMLGDISIADNIYIITRYTDMRKSIDGLCAVIMDQMKADPDGHAICLFCGKRCDRIKVLLREQAKLLP